MNILITGASSGIGAALAKVYSARGVTLYLSGRNQERLNEVAHICQRGHAVVHTTVIDVCDREAMAAYILRVDEHTPLDLVIANAGISAGMSGEGEDEEQVRDVLATNMAGVLNTILPIIPRMQARNSGHIAIMSSLASFRSMPTAPAYSASKAAVRFYGEAMRPVLARDNVVMSVICPGFIETPLTDVNNFTMPFLMNAKKAAHIIKSGLDKKRGRIAFPWQMYLPLLFISALPPQLTDWVFGRLPNK